MKIFIPPPAFLVGVIAVACCVPGNCNANSNCDDNSKLQYEAGKSYVYKINLVTYGQERPWNPEEHGSKKNTRPAHPPHHHIGNHIKATITTDGLVALTALPDCQYVLTLNQVTQKASAEQDSYVVRTVPVPRQSVKFTFKNGEISGLLQTNAGREPWADNILRGILTMIQNKALNNADGDPEDRETNIKGDCFCQVKIPKEGVYHKYIPTGECSDALISRQALGVPYPTSMFTPITKTSRRHLKHSHMQCTQVVDQGLISQVNCTARDHLLVPMDSVSTITVLTNETLEAATQEEITAMAKDMPFVYDPSPNTIGDATEINQAIVRLAQAMYKNQDANKAELFLQLQEMVAHVKDFSQLEQALGEVAGEEKFQAHFLKNVVREAATESGSEAAVVHLAKLVDDKELDSNLILEFYRKLPYNRDPTIAGLTALLSNLDGIWNVYQSDNFITFHLKEKKRIRMLLVGASAYAYQYCRHDPSCAGVPQYESVANKISQFCDSKQVDIAPSCAQALGNLPHLPANSVEAIKTMLQSTGEALIGLNRKLIAFDAFRRDPCQPELKALALESLENTQNAQDLRIVAYLAVVRCPLEEDLKAIDKILQGQWDTPLSSFIASHVHNIMDSQSPSKSYLKESPLGTLGIPMNIASVHNNSLSSRFVEYSSFRPDSNVGFSSEAHVIFKDDGSQVPQFAQVNITVDLYGKSYNVFQIGASRRYFPQNDRVDSLVSKGVSMLTNHGELFDMLRHSMIPALFGVDSYVRVFGTTVAMGPDFFSAFKSSHFVEKEVDPKEKAWRVEFVKPFTLLNKEIIMPNMAGLPITMTAQAVYLPMIKLKHTGDRHGLGIFSLLSRWDESTGQFRHESSSDTGILGKVSFHAGRGTPVSIRYNAVGKVHLNHSIAYESLKNSSSNWVKRIQFPDKVLWSEHVAAEITFSMDAAGQQVFEWPVFGKDTPRPSRKAVQFERMGLRFSVDSSPTHRGPVNVLVKVEKTEESFTGYSLDIESKARSDSATSIDLKLTADGLSTEDSLKINFDYDAVYEHELTGDNDHAKATLTLQTDFLRKNTPSTGFRAVYSVTGYPKSQQNRQSPLTLITGSKMPQSFGLSLESWAYSQKIPLLDWSLTNEMHSSQATLKFLGPLHRSLGSVTTKVEMPTVRATDTALEETSPHDYAPEGIIRVDIAQESQMSGKNGLAVGFSNVREDGLQLNASLTCHGRTYRLHQHFAAPVVEGSIDADGYPVGTTGYFDSRSYTIHYHDSGTAMEVSVKGQVDQRYLTDSSLTNVTLHISGPVQVLVEGHSRQGVITLDESTKNTLSYRQSKVTLDIFGQRTLDLNSEQNTTQTKMAGSQDNSPVCAGEVTFSDQGEQYCDTTTGTASFTVVDKGQLHVYFSNDAKPEISEFNMTFHHSHPDFSGDLRIITEIPEASRGLKIKHTTWMNLQNIPKQGEKLIHKGLTELDFENRTFSQSGLTTVNPGWRNTTLTAKGTWPVDLLNGDTTFTVAHTNPTKKKFTVDLLNQARSPQTPEEVFNNTLTVLWQETGMTYQAQPQKQFTWLITSGSRMTPEEQEKYKAFIKMNNQMKVLILSQPASEIFQLQENSQMKQALHNEWYTLSAQGNLLFQNVPKGNWDYEVEWKNVPEPEQSNEVDTTGDSTAVAAPGAAPMMSLTWRGDGWFQTNIITATNHTWSTRGTSEATIAEDIQTKEKSSFAYKQIDQAHGTVTMAMDAEGTKDFVFKDFTHFSFDEKITLVTDNSTTEICKHFAINGPHVTVLFKLNNTNVPKDNILIDFAGGMYEEKHQHKFNWRSSGRPHHHHHHHHRHHHHHHHDEEQQQPAPGQLATHHVHRPYEHPPPPHMFARFLPSSNFNYTVSK